MDLFRNRTDKTGTVQVPFTSQILSQPFVFLSEPFHFFRSCKLAWNHFFFVFESSIVIKLLFHILGQLSFGVNPCYFTASHRLGVTKLSSVLRENKNLGSNPWDFCVRFWYGNSNQWVTLSCIHYLLWKFGTLFRLFRNIQKVGWRSCGWNPF